MSFGAVLLLSLGLALLVPFTFYALRARSLVRLENGQLVSDDSELERLFGPLFRRRMRGAGGYDQVLQKLEWARIGFFTPGTWILATTLAGPLLFLLFFALFTLLGLEPGSTLILSGMAGGGGFLYPRSTLSRKLRERQKRIARDVIPFIGLYARTATIIHDTTSVFAKMLEIAARENADRMGGKDAMLRRSTRQRQNNPYQSDLWLGLEVMMRERTAGIHRKGATGERPDPLMSYATFVNDREFFSFIDRVRQARDQQRHISAEQLDVMVSNLQQHRLQEIRRGFARLLAKATVVLVAFGMPLLFTAVGAPLIYAVLHGLG